MADRQDDLHPYLRSDGILAGRLDVDGQPLGVALFRDATKPYIRPPSLVVLGVLLVGLLVVDWANGSTRLVSDSIGRAALLGAIIGVFVAYSDIAVGVRESTVIVRNPFLITRVPLALVDAVDARLGVYLRVRDRRLAVRVAAATGLLRFRQNRPVVLAHELQTLVDEARHESVAARVRVSVKATWFVTIPVGVGLFILVDLLSHAMR